MYDAGCACISSLAFRVLHFCSSSTAAWVTCRIHATIFLLTCPRVYHPLHFPCTANKIMSRDHRHTTTNPGGGVYAQPKLPPEHYVGDFDEIQLGLPGSAPCGLRTCCCCLNAGEFETIRMREEPSRAPCCPSSRPKASRHKGSHDVGRARECAASSALINTPTCFFCA